MVTIEGSHILDEVKLGRGRTGKGMYEASVYISSRNLSQRQLLYFSVQYDDHNRSSTCLNFFCPEPVNPTITVNCTKLN
ncbi:MAG: hypothetical protein K0S27_1602 [Gammaproteobacteria bacterium]|nr:hypothetical protein [Gammaproteobacteria bacterium]